MADAPPPVPSLARAREQKISELSQYFANDDLTLDELERRIERVYRAANVLELEEITADLRTTAPTSAGAMPPARGDARAVAPISAPAQSRIFAFMGENKRLGRWQVPQRLEVRSIMSDTRLDLTQAVLSPGVTEIHLRGFWSACKIIVPHGMRVINEMHAIMASVTSKAHEMDPPGAKQTGGPIIRLTGRAIMSEVKVVVRTVEGVIDDDEDDE